MDRTYVAQQQRTPVYQLGLELWREHVVRKREIGERMRAVLLDQVHRERNGEAGERGLMRSITQVRRGACTSALLGGRTGGAPCPVPHRQSGARKTAGVVVRWYADAGGPGPGGVRGGL